MRLASHCRISVEPNVCFTFLRWLFRTCGESPQSALSDRTAEKAHWLIWALSELREFRYLGRLWRVEGLQCARGSASNAKNVGAYSKRSKLIVSSRQIHLVGV